MVRPLDAAAIWRLVDAVAPDMVVICGPTASGKSDLAMHLAEERRATAIICCDSVQVYRDFTIGSTKPSASDRHRVRHEMLDLVTWRDPFDAGAYAEKAQVAVATVRSEGLFPVLVAGTGLYLRALLGVDFHKDLPTDLVLRGELAKLTTSALADRLKELDPARAGQLHPNDRVRLQRSLELVLLRGQPLSTLTPVRATTFTTFSIYLRPPRPVLHARISERSHKLVASGLRQEVEDILAQGCPIDAKPMQSIGYRQMAMGLAGEISENDVVERIIFATRQYAKRQITWFNAEKHDLIAGE